MSIFQILWSYQYTPMGFWLCWLRDSWLYTRIKDWCKSSPEHLLRWKCPSIFLSWRQTSWKLRTSHREFQRGLGTGSGSLTCTSREQLEIFSCAIYELIVLDSKFSRIDVVAHKLRQTNFHLTIIFTIKLAVSKTMVDLSMHSIPVDITNIEVQDCHHPLP